MPETGVQAKITVEESGNSNKQSIKTTRTYTGTCVNQNRRGKQAKGAISSKTEAYLAACNSHTMSYNLPSAAKPLLPRLESITRISSIPLVESSIEIGEKLYAKIKDTNVLTKWYLSAAESSLHASVNFAMPALIYLSGPISKIDDILCKSLDAVEQRVPSMYLPPQVMYSNAQDYVSSHLVKPVLRRADSVKQLGTAVLDSRAAAFAADKLDSALDKADIYVDKYLPADSQDVTDSPNNSNDNTVSNNDALASRMKAVQTIQHVDRLSRKLKRRITQRTLQEARALKEQTTEAIHVLIYVAELIAKDPKLAMDKARELWGTLSQDEPENQARPATLEQLIVMLTRESARRLVHLINFTTNTFAKLPKTFVHNFYVASHQFLVAADSLVKRVHLEKAKKSFITEAMAFKTRFEIIISEIQHRSRVVLEQVAMIIAGNTEREKIRTSRCHLRNHHYLNANNLINGVN
ncbi:lipid storage droplet-1 isoform X2 [Arctopsyche grandis]|uniref:lipid storage droplet-1 isoform X2 n=1 Tax=Arctopsyche grandis TaxID=121162 RepID=UPI00406D96D5